MDERERGAQLFQEGQEKLSNFYERAPYCGGGIHSTDYHAIIVRDYFIPAAEYGYLPAMKECGDYFCTSDKERAFSYYRKYLKACPYDKATKAFLVAQFGLKMFFRINS